ncbi:MAG: helix-turn-helix domain-containing protein [Ilumatobacteraceae bacterium]
MSTKITARQREILDFIELQMRDHGYPPSVREIGEAVGLTSPSTVHSHLNTLERLGHLRRDPTKPAPSRCGGTPTQVS